MYAGAGAAGDDQLAAAVREAAAGAPGPGRGARPQRGHAEGLTVQRRQRPLGRRLRAGAAEAEPRFEEAADLRAPLRARRRARAGGGGGHG